MDNLGIYPPPPSPANPLGAGAAFSGAQNVADGGTAVAWTDLNTCIDCYPTTAAGCAITFPASPVNKQAVTVKTGASTTATNKVSITASQNVEAPLALGTFPAMTATMTQAGMCIRWVYSTAKTQWEIM